MGTEERVRLVERCFSSIITPLVGTDFERSVGRDLSIGGVGADMHQHILGMLAEDLGCWPKEIGVGYLAVGARGPVVRELFHLHQRRFAVNVDNGGGLWELNVKKIQKRPETTRLGTVG